MTISIVSFRTRALTDTLALLMIAGLVGCSLPYHQATPPAEVTGYSAAIAAPASAADPLNCRLPVIVTVESGSGQTATEPGFVDTRSGQYAVDGTASIAGLPGGAYPAPASYSGAAKRWLPVGQSLMSPDGLSYLWVRLLPNGSTSSTFQRAELHRHDLATSVDYPLWTYAGSISVHRWDRSGILLDTVPSTGGAMILWLVDSQTGAASPQRTVTGLRGLTLLPGEGANGAFSYGTFGADALGRTLYHIGSRQPGDQEWIFFESSPGHRVTIYRGRQGDATGFDPFQAMGDGRGIWFSDYETRGLWYWEPSSGLHKVAVMGLSPPPSGQNSNVYVDPAASCM